ncbi:MAG TPA: gliding motility-associated C-terminal domain-containing protein, partial [Flavobacteriales bacterium]|nr:gliding motility-associated C-terminal domain-containing protein [Flavobacteriales bacterium]
ILAAVTLHAQTEDCGNGLDDDGDGLVDCADPDCSSGSVPTGAFFNTATNGAGGVLAGGSFDSNWDFATGSAAGPYTPAIVMTIYPGSYYPSPWADCDWIAHNATGTHSVNTDYYYRIQFYLPCTTPCGASYATPGVFCLNMDFFADNSVTEVLVNGVVQTGLAGVPPPGDPYYHVGFSAAGGVSLTLCNDWQPGLNELIIHIASGPGYSGFLAQNSTTSPPVTGDPTILPAYVNTTSCLDGGIVDFDAASTGGTWTASCGTCIDAATGAFDPMAAGVGAYTVVYALTVPCPASDTTTITVIDTADATIVPVAPVCANTAAFAFTSATPGGTWSATCGTCINATTGVFDPNIAGAGTYTITHSFSAPCAATDNETITVLPVPDPGIVPPAVMCNNGSAVTLTAATAGGTWSATCGTCINSATGLFNPAAAGSGSWTVTYSLGGTCPASDIQTVNVLPFLNATINPVGLKCSSEAPFAFTAASTGGTWSATCGACINASTGVVDPSLLSAGTYTITYTTPAPCGTTDTETLTISDANLMAVPTAETCNGYGDGIILAVGSGTGPFTYTITGPETATNTSGNFTGLDAGTYTVTVTNTDGCTDVNTSVVGSPAPVIAAFTATPNIGLLPLNVVFTNTSTGATSYVWDLVVDTVFTTNASGTYVNEDQYTIVLYAMNGACADTAYLTIEAISPSELDVYNVFSPNGDGVNDVFITTWINLSEFSIKIYNRWGQLMFESNDQTKGWDGKDLGGKDATDGTYYYLVKAKGKDEQAYDQHGHVTLFRNK